MLRFFKIALLCITLLLVAAAGALYAYSQMSGPLDHPETVIVPRGIGFRGAVSALEERNVIGSSTAFTLFAMVSGNARLLKAGEYAFPAGISPSEVMHMLVEGRVVPHPFTVPEGYTVSDIQQALANEPLLSGDIPGAIAEGSLLPETYYFVYGDTRKAVVDRMRLAMTVAMAGLWQKRSRDLPFETPLQAVTLASIVEKETAVEEERRHIAAVYINRLKRGMRLQADPTVAYAIEKEKGRLERPLTKADLAYPSLYNTYLVPGLPPGPICNPGRASLEAVFDPIQTDDYYFVADGEGGHVFSSTLDQHNGNVREYRKRVKSPR